MQTSRLCRPLLAVGVACLLLVSCKSMYYDTMETFGVEKRDILSDRVADGRDEQQDAKEQFQSALEAFKSVTSFEGGDLEELYDRLSDELKRSEGAAKDVRGRIESIESVANDLFEEWQQELEQYTDPKLRGASEGQLEATRQRYESLIEAMWRAEASMEPVLSTFRDQVLYLKHNLNAQAIAALQDSVLEIETDVARLVAEMEAAIDEANAFIQTTE